jgi:hypothetical protein
MLSVNVQSSISRGKQQIRCFPFLFWIINHTLVLSVHCPSPITWGKNTKTKRKQNCCNGNWYLLRLGYLVVNGTWCWYWFDGKVVVGYQNQFWFDGKVASGNMVSASANFNYQMYEFLPNVWQFGTRYWYRFGIAYWCV